MAMSKEGSFALGAIIGVALLSFVRRNPRPNAAVKPAALPNVTEPPQLPADLQQANEPARTGKPVTKIPTRAVRA